MEKDTKKSQEEKVEQKKTRRPANKLNFRIAHNKYDYGEPIPVVYVGIFCDNFDN